MVTLLGTIKAIDEIASAPIDRFETDELRLQMIKRLCDRVLKEDEEELCPYCGGEYSENQPDYHRNCHLIGRND